jgi:hypothetical protein
VRNNATVGIALAGLVLGFGASAEKLFAQSNPPVTVLELFTSQGCSSCPPADALLAKMAKQEGILALTLPVNYWDYLGWKDTLAAESFSKRQRSYAEARGDHEIYTPQLIVNGMTHVVGSRPDAIAEAIDRTGKVVQASHVPIDLEDEDSDVVVQVGGAPTESEYRSGTVWVALYAPEVNVDIRRGENLGRTITYTNVVRHLVPAGHWEGEAATFRMKRPGDTVQVKGCAAFLQADKGSAIIGAAIEAEKTN